jgi:teichuronic acid biosynthesis glycosyltransferase TuaC
MGQGFFGASHAAVCVARELGVPCVNWAIGSDVNVLPGLSDENRRLLRHDVRISDLVLAVSADLQRRIEALCRGAKNVRTLYWGIDQAPAGEPPDRDALRAELGMAAGRKYMLSAGAGQREKGTREFYEAFRLLARRRGDLSAIWVGAGAELAAMKRRAEADGLGGKLLLPGAQPHDETMKYMLSADVLAFPTWREGLPNVVLEAMACGLPVVASAVSGIPEVILEGVTGRLVPAQDAPALASAVEDALIDAPASARMAERAQAFVRRHFDGRSNAMVALDILRRVVAGTALDEPLPLCAEAPPGVAPLDLLRREN